MIIEELQHLINIDPDMGVEHLFDGPAVDDRIKEWFETPVGSMADHPSWGHNLAQFKHDPLDTTLEIRIKLAIFNKLPVDVRDIVIQSIGVEFIDIYRCKVLINHQIGIYTGEVIL